MLTPVAAKSMVQRQGKPSNMVQMRFGSTHLNWSRWFDNLFVPRIPTVVPRSIFRYRRLRACIEWHLFYRALLQMNCLFCLAGLLSTERLRVSRPVEYHLDTPCFKTCGISIILKHGDAQSIKDPINKTSNSFAKEPYKRDDIRVKTCGISRVILRIHNIYVLCVIFFMHNIHVFILHNIYEFIVYHTQYIHSTQYSCLCVVLAFHLLHPPMTFGLNLTAL